MSDHITEEEQIETAKRWWNENGRSVVVGVLVAVVAYFGWQGWQAQQKTAKETASLLFEDMMEAAVVEPGEKISEDRLLKAQAIADELKKDHSSGLYASNAALWMAKLAVESGDLAKGATELQWVMDKEVNQGIALVARLRLAQVQYAEENFDKALATLDGDKAGAFDAAFNELRGDIFVAQQKLDEAVAVYEKALAALSNGQNGRRDIIQMKLDDIKAETSQSKSTVSNVDSVNLKSTKADS